MSPKTQTQTRTTPTPADALAPEALPEAQPLKEAEVARVDNDLEKEPRVSPVPVQGN